MRPTSVNHATMLIGEVIEVDLATALARVMIGEIESDWLGFHANRAGIGRSWHPPSVGEQVIVLAVGEELESGAIIGALYSNDRPPPVSHAGSALVFDDGTRIDYDPATKALTAILPAGGTIAITAPAGVTISGPVTIEGDVTLTGKLTASDDVIASGKSLKSHKHLGVTAGSAQSGVPA
jgi:phage baseplate assembly protein V